MSVQRKVDLQDEDVSNEIQYRFLNLCSRYPQTFLPEDFGCANLAMMDIETEDSLPFSQRPHNLPSKHRAWLKRVVNTGKTRNHCLNCFSLGYSHCGHSKTNPAGRTYQEEGYLLTIEP